MTAFLLTWKESGWPHENIVRMVASLQRQGFVDEPWRIAAHKSARPGDRVWVLRQGRGPKGIFGAGHIIGAPSPGSAGNGKVQMLAPVRFESFVDPHQRLLISEGDVAAILRPNQIRAQASGYPIDNDQSEAFEQIIANSEPLELGGEGDWTKAELEAIVTDYFAMLSDELTRKPYSKTEHRNELRKIISRSPGSIERKHQNISAVLQELGLPWIYGYKPSPHFQDALVDCVEAKLDNGSIVQLDKAEPIKVEQPTVVASIFVPPPAPKSRKVGKSLVRVNGKFDPAARDEGNRVLGKAGEDYVVLLERHRLESIGRKDLADKVTWVADQCHLGYDIESFNDDGNSLLIEVKTTRGSIDTPFYISENERRVADARGGEFRIYRLFGFGADPKIYILSGPLESVLALEPIAYRARVIAL